MQIVAPAGSRAGLHAAVNAGADAVYLGLPLFGARAKAENFRLETLADDINFAHVFGTKVFITLNTLIKDGEMKTALDMARHAYECGADAAIVQDLRYIEKLKKSLPDFPLHASTQMGVHNAVGAEKLLDMGIRRAVLARETLPSDISEIKRTGIEIEFFVQGALCICFSGNCYFSSLASSYSGNRGKCMQLCRKPYMFNGNRGYHLSAKDICLYDKLDRLQALGVDAIKIEGRMRSEEYVSQAVSVYKSNMPKDEAVSALKAVFNRGDYCGAYLDDDASFNVVYRKTQGNIGTHIGKIDVLSDRKIIVNGFNAHSGDGFKILRNGTEIGGAHVTGSAIIADCACRPGDELRRTFDGKLSEELRRFERKLKIDVDVKLALGTTPYVKASACGITVVYEGKCIPQSAISRAITKEDVLKAFYKVSDNPFAPTINVEMDDDIFMPISELNALRRSAYGKLYSAIAEKNSLERKKLPEFKLEYNKFDGHGVILVVDDASVLDSDILNKIDYVALEPNDYADFAVPTIDKPILLSAPVAARGRDMEIIKSAISRHGISGVISNNLYTLGITNKPILLGTGHNIIGKCDMPHIASFEADCVNGFAYVYGYAPVMTLCHCPYEKCVKCDGHAALFDEQNRKFVLRRYKLSHCYWQMLNCYPHNLTDSAEKYPDRVYDCKNMDAERIRRVLDGKISGEYTRGNIGKGLK